MISRAIRLGMVLMAAGLAVCPASAQWGAGPRGPAGKHPGVQTPPPERFSASGTIEGVIRGKIKLKSTTGQTWIVNVGKGTEVVVKGEAAPEVLTPRTWIRATMAIDRKGRTKEPISALTVISQKEDTVVGVFPVQQPGGFDAPQPQPQAADPLATTDYDVVGMLSAMKKGKYVLKTQAGGQVVDIEFELTEDAAIELNVEDYSLAKMGDEITVAGTILQQAQGEVKPGEVTGIGDAATVTIQLKEKIAPAQKGKRTRKPAPPKASGRDEESPEADKPEAEDGKEPKPEEGKEKEAPKDE